MRRLQLAGGEGNRDFLESPRAASHLARTRTRVAFSINNNMF